MAQRARGAIVEAAAHADEAIRLHMLLLPLRRSYTTDERNADHPGRLARASRRRTEPLSLSQTQSG
jgi:hypothetical protein